ncbi:isochorismatase family protein [Nannocystis pusilla]|uniref:isochorismatase family protein n=1 Tax=Nannocystis pusilla TaxID=889268 RepID=UPI003B7D59B5
MSPGSLALLTDLYQVTMACGYWKLGRADEEAVFNLFFRRAPFRGAHAIAAGLQEALRYMAEFRFTPEDVAYLGTLRGNDGQRLLEPGFLAYLASLRLTLDVEAVPEGTPVFPHEPLLRVRGPLAQCQLLETPLLNCINFSTLIATKAARICEAAGGDPVVEFGLRRAQGSGVDPEVDSYSGFFDNGRRRSTGLGDYLRVHEVREVVVLGLATDYCVKFTTLDALSLGMAATLVEDGCRGVELAPGDVAAALAEVRAAGGAVRRSADLLG